MIKYIICFKDLFSSITIDSIQETYPKISIYNNIIVQLVEETNLKYGLDLKFTILEAAEVGLWARTFQVVDYHKDNQVSRQQMPSQHLEPPQQPPHKDTTTTTPRCCIGGSSHFAIGRYTSA